MAKAHEAGRFSMTNLYIKGIIL